MSRRRRQCFAFFCILIAVTAMHAQSGFRGRADFIITFSKSVPSRAAIDSILGQYDCLVKYRSKRHGIAAVRIPLGMSLNAAASLLKADHRIERVEPDFLVSVVSRFPNDPYFDRQWALYNPAHNRADIKAVEAWQMTRGNKRIVVAIIDTGIDYLHPDLARNIWMNENEIAGNNRDDDGNGYADDIRGWDFVAHGAQPMDRYFHGTLMAGIVGAQADNGEGIAGIMHDVSLMAVKGLGDRGYGYTSDLIACIYYAVDNGAHVINASWGGGGYLQALCDAIAYAGRHDVLFVAAAGNYQRDNDRFPFYPASYDLENIISVAATNRFDSLADFSHYGAASVDLAAPGVAIVSTTLNAGYLSTSGTSMAAPHVSACVGLLLSYAAGLNWRDYKSIILSSVHPRAHLKGMCVSGGRLDMLQALKRSAAMRSDMRVAVYYLLERLQKGEDEP
jgi:subtilisin family serine protease